MAEVVEKAATPCLVRALWPLGLVAVGNVTPLYSVFYW
jgi:hypothetical protein